MIARHWRNLARARSLIDAGIPKAQIEEAVGVPAYFLDGLLGQARRQPAARFALGLREIADTDQALKAAAKQKGTTEDEFIFSLIETISGRKVEDSIWTPIQKVQPDRAANRSLPSGSDSNRTSSAAGSGR